MANIKSAKKRIKVIAKKTAINKSNKTELKTAEKKFLEAVESGDKTVAQERLVEFTSKAQKVAATNLIHKNKAARKVSRMTIKLNKMN